MLVGDVVNSVRAILLDPVPTTWLDPAILLWLNDVLAAAANLKRDINPQIISVPLVSGSVQALPATAVQLLEPYYNTASLKACTISPMTPLQRRVPAWRSATTSIDASDIFVDERTPLIFHCYPPNTGAGSIQALCGVVPFLSGAGLIPLNTSAVAIPVPDNYRQAIVDGVVSKAMGANTRRQDIQKATVYWQKFEAGIVGGKMGQRETAPQFDDKEER
jgi:hypothetical protein